MNDESRKEKLQRMLAQQSDDQQAWEQRKLIAKNSTALKIGDWITLTGIPVGRWGKYTVRTQGVFFGEWSDQQIEYFSADQQLKMTQENLYRLRFPCSGRELAAFFDNDASGCLGDLPDHLQEVLANPPSKDEIRAEEILRVCNYLGYDPMNIPFAGKSRIKAKCIKDDPSFYSSSSFDDGWKEARNQNLVMMENHEKHAKR